MFAGLKLDGVGGCLLVVVTDEFEGVTGLLPNSPSCRSSFTLKDMINHHVKGLIFFNLCLSYD